MQFFVDSYADLKYRSVPLASPTFANFKNMPPVYLQYSSNEVLSGECKDFADKLNNFGVEVALNVGRDLWHNWHLSGGLFPESVESIKTVAKFIIDKTMNN